MLVFVKIRQKNSSLRTVIIYENFKFTQEYAFAERCCILTFSFEGKLKEYDISLKRKYMKTNENMIFSVLFRNVHQPENSFFHAVITTWATVCLTIHFQYIFVWFSTRDHVLPSNFFKKTYINIFFKKLMVTRCNALRNWQLCSYFTASVLEVIQ